MTELYKINRLSDIHQRETIGEDAFEAFVVRVRRGFAKFPYKLFPTLLPTNQIEGNSQFDQIAIIDA